MIYKQYGLWARNWILKFADDTRVFGKALLMREQTQVLEVINALISWSEKWQCFSIQVNAKSRISTIWIIILLLLPLQSFYSSSGFCPGLAGWAGSRT